MDGIRCEIFFRKNLNPKFINRVRRIMTTMIWPYEKHGQKECTEKGIRIKF